MKAQDTYKTVQINEDLLRYIIQLTEATRQHPELSLGVSPRGAQALLKASQAWAALHGRDFVLPDDIKVLAEPVLAHRLVFRNRIRQQEGLAERIIQELLNQKETQRRTSLQAGVSLMALLWLVLVGGIVVGIHGVWFGHDLHCESSSTADNSASCVVMLEMSLRWWRRYRMKNESVRGSDLKQ